MVKYRSGAGPVSRFKTGSGSKTEYVKIMPIQPVSDPQNWGKKLRSATSVGDPGSGAFLIPGYGIRIGFFQILDFGSRIPNPYFGEFSNNFLGKNL
jgi:hypothetical protein